MFGFNESSWFLGGSKLLLHSSATYLFCCCCCFEEVAWAAPTERFLLFIATVINYIAYMCICVSFVFVWKPSSHKNSAFLFPSHFTPSIYMSFYSTNSAHLYLLISLHQHFFFYLSFIWRTIKSTNENRRRTTRTTELGKKVVNAVNHTLHIHARALHNGIVIVVVDEKLYSGNLSMRTHKNASSVLWFQTIKHTEKQRLFCVCISEGMENNRNK